jgi:hypothetical protein
MTLAICDFANQPMRQVQSDRLRIFDRHNMLRNTALGSNQYIGQHALCARNIAWGFTVAMLRLSICPQG